MKLAKESFGIAAVLESDDEIVRVPDDNDIARRMSIPPLLDP
jgi:hypothetical protein